MTENKPFDEKQYIKDMYDSQLKSQKETLTQNYEQNAAELERQQQAAQKQKDTDLTRTYVEAAKAQKNYDEVQNAYGLTSGAMAQARLAQDNQLQADLTAIRTAQQAIDADVEREKGLLSKEYQSAIAKAQADNDIALAEALYKQAQAEDERLKEKQKAAANLMAAKGDYSLLGQLYGLTDDQIALLGGSSGGPRYTSDIGTILDAVKTGRDAVNQPTWGVGLNETSLISLERQLRTMMNEGRYDLVEKKLADITDSGVLSEEQAKLSGDILISGGYGGG